MIAGLVKAYGFTVDYVLYGMSMANATMYGAVLPVWRPKRDGGRGGDPGAKINADDPANNGKIEQLLKSMQQYGQ